MLIVYYRTKYQEWIIANPSRLKEHQPISKDLILKSGVTTTRFSFAQPIGYGYVSTAKADALDNITQLDDQVVGLIAQAFLTAKGVYKKRILESINPLYWINCILYLPKHIFTYLNFDPDIFFVKLFQLIWWIICPVALLFRDEVWNIVISLIQQLN